ncbi:uncharacterized mitochondrial protein AtMg00810-like [Nicotiana tomentosiformis]|uniref:Uncharacterized mitochondrial protein AtMg00810-like n=1 Tax=Nicotiana tabacum TaxID=4097 RepID=A0A1S3XLD9_TOBAC|nr:PREDICTED: uncharacterized mitochondrial protein AtMg00810-like [Nicotiana tabacum]
MQSPGDSHLKAAAHVLGYLKGNLSLGTFLSNSRDYRVRAFCDSDWAACPETRMSVSGYIILLGDSRISWKSKKQSTISLSSAEAVHQAALHIAKNPVFHERTKHIEVDCHFWVFSLSSIGAQSELDHIVNPQYFVKGVAIFV